jgi:hypothetical protein
MDFVPANIVQADLASSGPPTALALPFQFSGKAESNFAASLQTAKMNSASAPVESASDAGTVVGRKKSTDKNSPTNPPTPPLGQAASAINSTTNITASVVLQDSILPSAANLRSDATTGLTAGTDAVKPDRSFESRGKVQADASLDNSATAFDAGVTLAKSGSGEQTPVGDVAAPLEIAAAHLETEIPFPGGDPPPLLTPLTENKTGKQAPAQNAGAEADVRQDPSATLSKSLAGFDALVPRLSLSAGELVGTSGKGDLRPPLPSPEILRMPQPGMTHASGAAKATAEIGPSASESKPQPDNDPRQESLPGLLSASTASTLSGVADVLKPISVQAAKTMKAIETVPAVETRANDTPLAHVPSTSEGTRQKPADSSSSPTEPTVLQPSLKTGFVPPSGQTIGVDQPTGTTATGATVQAQVAPAANQDPGNVRPGSPAAEPQHPAASSATPVPAPGPVEAARLVASALQSEMHIGLRTQAFGSVEVHTVVRDSQVGLTVGSERGDLHTLLGAEVSGLQTIFRQQDLRFDNIRFLETGAGTTAGFSGGADSQARSSSQQHSLPAGPFPINHRQQDAVELDLDSRLRARLNVHA